jgi:hypothetical protein
MTTKVAKTLSVEYFANIFRKSDDSEGCTEKEIQEQANADFDKHLKVAKRWIALDSASLIEETPTSITYILK